MCVCCVCVVRVLYVCCVRVLCVCCTCAVCVLCACVVCVVCCSSETCVLVLCAQIRADPADINILPEYSSDPRVVQNLLDGVNRTRCVCVPARVCMFLDEDLSPCPYRDDLHMWLAPFTRGGNHFIYLTFQRKVVVSVIRIWVRMALHTHPHTLHAPTLHTHPHTAHTHTHTTCPPHTDTAHLSISAELQQVAHSLLPRCKTCSGVPGWHNHF